MQQMMTDLTGNSQGSGFVFAHDNQLYPRTKTKADINNLKCFVNRCPGSAKIAEGEFCTTVKVNIYFFYKFFVF